MGSLNPNRDGAPIGTDVQRAILVELRVISHLLSQLVEQTGGNANDPQFLRQEPEFRAV